MSRFGCFSTTHGTQKCYRCHFCPYDTFNQTAMDRHLALSHPGPPKFPVYDLDLAPWVVREVGLARFSGLKVTLGLLTWNSRDASMFSAYSVRNESIRLNMVGIKPHLAWADNGSTDKTVEGVESEVQFETKSLFTFNQGCSVGRNELISAALANGSKYLLMLDGDIQMIPWSTYAMINYLEGQEEEVGCIGLYSPNCAPTWEKEVSPDCRKIYPEMVREGVIAWTQYGLFRVSMFERGLRFDTDPVFLGPGWGLEDDDLFRQMRVMGYQSHHTKFFRCIHRNRGGSVSQIGRELATGIFLARQEYLNQKWGRNSFNYSESAIPDL